MTLFLREQFFNAHGPGLLTGCLLSLVVSWADTRSPPRRLPEVAQSRLRTHSQDLALLLLYKLSTHGGRLNPVRYYTTSRSRCASAS